MKFKSKMASLIATAAAVLAVTSALAATVTKPATQGAGAQAIGVKFGGFFNDQQKQAARHAFTQKYAKAKECPPGLEKKEKGKACASPWNTRYWAVGQELQPAVQVYPVAEIESALPPAPKGYEYVRAADDILLIASGTKLVVDMIENVTS